MGQNQASILTQRIQKTRSIEKMVCGGISITQALLWNGGDLNVDEIHEVIPITEDCGVWHPQEGVFNGHFQPKEAQKSTELKIKTRGN